ncbi:MAG: lysophospholipid acyltransferase family protein [Gammaproteobacteria bacterium]|nr:lysophospholipid acyltransferase family protein [Gammaproteobacteria bacterium]
MLTTRTTRDADLPPLPRWVRLAAALPWSVLYALAGALAWCARVLLRLRVRVARENLEGCFPDWLPGHVGQTLRAHYRGLAEVMVEFIKQARLSPAELAARMPFIDAGPVRAALAADRPVMIVTAHFANWEWALQRLRLEFGVPVIGAYKPPRSSAADRTMTALRSRFGVRMVAAKRLLRELSRLRGQPHIAAFIADQVPTSSPNRHWLRFLGRETAFFPGPAEIARIGRYEAYYIDVRRTARGRYTVRFVPIAAAGEACEPLEFTRRYAAIAEQQIRAAPEHWMWVHRRWKLEPPEAEEGNTRE